ncbi:MAG TPA: two-component regulator propeller domain-containing protein [Acidobacteriaceae bacterium]|nr:two-component regulator propeller domain-containing protein [Acidobacteriaceae bacterium]
MMAVRRIRRVRGIALILQLAAVGAMCARPARGLDPAKTITQYVQTSWNNESGLPENSVHALAQTKDGYLWMGTEEGLTRFDGVRFATFTYHNAPGLASSFIRTLAADRDGSLWVGTDSGLSHYEPSGTAAGYRFVTLTTKDGLTGNSTLALCEDRNGALWVATRMGLNRIVDGRVEDWTSGRGLPDAAVNAIAMDTGGTVWVGTAKGLSRFERGHFVTYTRRDGLPDDNITALAAAPDGSIWVGTASQGVAQIHGSRITEPTVSLPWQEIDGLMVDRDGGLWIAFDHHGIGRLYRNDLDLYGAAKGLPSDLSSGALLEDHEGSVWVGLLDAGVVQLRDGKFTLFGKSEGLSGNYIAEIVQAPDGSMYIGADNFGVNRLYPDGHVEVLNQRNGLPNQPVYSLLVAHDGSLWIGYRHGTLARMDRGHVSIFHDPQAPDAPMDSLYQDRDGRIWVGYDLKGLAWFEDGSFHHVTSTGTITCITQSRDGALWLAVDGDGVQRYFHGTLTRYGTADGLPNEHPMYVYADDDGSVWVALANGGLSWIRNGRVATWTPAQGLPDTTIGSILEDDFGNFWMGGNDGVFRVAKAELERTAGQPGAMLHPVIFGQANGLRMSETLYGSMPCAWKARDGRLWFATIDGAAVVDPANMPMDRSVPPVLIEHVTVNAHAVPLNDRLRLGPSPATLEVAFTAPSFVAPQLVRFRYRLDGFDSDWEAAEGRSARYTNLPAGHYRFLVQAENADGIWNQTGASFSFVLRPPLAETPLAYVLYALFGLLIAWGVIALRTRNLVRRERELTRVVAERTSQLELEKAALEAARRELHIRATHDSLTGLFNRAAILEHLQREITRAKRDGEPLGVVLADLDNFKNINDNYGHLCGDDILRETAARFLAAVRGYDVVGRYGGEEFLILFPGWDFHHAPGRVEELLDAIRARPFQVEREEAELHLTCSAGVAVYRPEVDAPSIREILSRADTALYVAKNSGRNTASFEARPTL